MRTNKKFGIFISSTKKDLIKERREIVQSIYECQHIALGMENFYSGRSSIEMIKKAIDDCDIYLLLLGFKYGSIYQNGIGYTEWEFDYAVKKGKELCLLVITDEHCERKIKEGSKQGELYERDTALINNFREKVTNNGLNCYFINDYKDIKDKIRHKLTDQSLSEKLVGWVKSNSTDIKKDNSVLTQHPFIGDIETLTQIHNEEYEAEHANELYDHIINDPHFRKNIEYATERIKEDIPEYIRYAVMTHYLTIIDNQNKSNIVIMVRAFIILAESEDKERIFENIDEILLTTQDTDVIDCCVRIAISSWLRLSKKTRLRIEGYLIDSLRDLDVEYYNEYNEELGYEVVSETLTDHKNIAQLLGLFQLSLLESSLDDMIVLDLISQKIKKDSNLSSFCFEHFYSFIFPDNRKLEPYFNTAIVDRLNQGDKNVYDIFNRKVSSEEGLIPFFDFDDYIQDALNSFREQPPWIG